MSDLHDADIVSWSEQQAALLRQRAGNELDWDALAIEIEEVGMGALQQVEGLLYQAIAHWLKAYCWPEARDVERWRHDYLNFLGQAETHCKAAWRVRIDLARIYETALRPLPPKMYGGPPAPPGHARSAW